MTPIEFAKEKGLSNIYEYAANEECIFENWMSDTNGYKRITTFYSDLSIAEFCSGIEGIKDTFERVCKEWKADVKFFTEFIMSLNIKAWAWDSRNNNDLVCLYSDLYYQALDLGYSTFDENGRQYLFEMTD